VLTGRGLLTINTTTVAGACVLSVSGVLDGTTYVPLRDAIKKAALDYPRAVIVDVTGLIVVGDSAWAVFPAAHWYITDRSDVPMGLVCNTVYGHRALCRNGIDRYVPAYSTLDAAVAELSGDGELRYLRRARAELPAVKGITWHCRELIKQWLTDWSRTDYIGAVSGVATLFVEDVLSYAGGAMWLRLETNAKTVTVAVDASNCAWRQQPTDSSGNLRLVASACRAWGTSPLSSRTTKWAVIGPENLR
jgi:hypothetical protein